MTTATDGRIHGMTANGFMSVSLSPALVVVSVGNDSHMKGLLDRSGVYGVSVLSVEQQPLSVHFAGRADGTQPVSFLDAGGVPLIEGALAHLAAKVVDAHPAGDHTLFVGEVTHVELRPGEPLVFHGGNYRALQAESEAESEWSMAWERTTDWL